METLSPGANLAAFPVHAAGTPGQVPFVVEQISEPVLRLNSRNAAWYISDTGLPPGWQLVSVHVDRRNSKTVAVSQS
jgi:hypothetical protein